MFDLMSVWQTPYPLILFMGPLGFWTLQKTTQVSQSTEEEEVPMPVQEVYGKCEQPFDV